MIKKRNLSGLIKFPDNYYRLKVPKQYISEQICLAMDEKKLNLDEIMKQIPGMDIEEVNKVTAGENYDMDSLLKVIDALDLELKLVRKNKENV